MLAQVLVVAAKQTFSRCLCWLQKFSRYFGRSTLWWETCSEFTVAHWIRWKIVHSAELRSFTCGLSLEVQELLCFRVNQTTFIVTDLREASSSTFDPNNFPETRVDAACLGWTRLNKWTALILCYLEIILELILPILHGRCHGIIILPRFYIFVRVERQIIRLKWSASLRLTSSKWIICSWSRCSAAHKVVFIVIASFGRICSAATFLKHLGEHLIDLGGLALYLFLSLGIALELINDDVRGGISFLAIFQ